MREWTIRRAWRARVRLARTLGSNPSLSAMLVSCNLRLAICQTAPIAQLDRVTDYESAGCPFESGWARQKARRNFSKKNALGGLTRFDNCGMVNNEKRKMFF